LKEIEKKINYVTYPGNCSLSFSRAGGEEQADICIVISPLIRQLIKEHWLNYIAHVCNA